MSSRLIWLLLRTALVVLIGMLGARSASAVEPLLHAHAHNDYWHQRPLLDALDQGFTSVEADVHLVDGKLLVGHDRKDVRAERDLETLYLKPLAERARRFNGHIYPNCDEFHLFVDIKTEAQSTSTALIALLARYRESLTLVEQGKIRPGAIRVIVTGNRPPIDTTPEQVSYFGWDGRISDLDRSLPAERMPMISDNWQDHFHWRGNGPMPQAEREKLQQIVDKSHSSGRALRFWATPENEAVWNELVAAKVDLIGTDQLARLAKFLQAKDER